MEFVMRGPLSAGITSEIGEFFYAGGAIKSGPGGGDDSENITVHTVPLTGIYEWLKARISEGKYIEPKVYAGIWFAGRFWGYKSGMPID
jgi:ADP-ribose pyrophosphatase